VKHDGNRLDYPSNLYLLSIELLDRFYADCRLEYGRSRREFLYDACTIRHGYAPAVITWPISVPVDEYKSFANINACETRQRIFSWALFALSNKERVMELSVDSVIDQFSLVFEMDANLQ
jgi:hypothetical protein